MPPEPEKRPVRVLPDTVANQIAAGEVVERPASVLKELVENSLDAGATRVGVEVEAGGRKLIRVVDDGGGMSQDDMLLALERHATSKVVLAEDLARVVTLGFRGEALPSIAAVSHLVLRSRQAGAEAGWRVEVAGGSIRKVEETGCPVGTLVEMRDIFFNLPARRKFLKSQATESAHLAEALARLALARPQVAFRYTVNGRLAQDLAASPDLAVRVGSLLGRETASNMLALDRELNGVRVWGLAGTPALSRASADQVYTMVNGRYVRDRVLLHAVNQAYQGLMPGGRRPVVVLHLELDPGLVDVNVHPAKVEVRFSRQQEVHEALSRILRMGLAGGRPAAPPAPPAPEASLAEPAGAPSWESAPVAQAAPPQVRQPPAPDWIPPDMPPARAGIIPQRPWLQEPAPRPAPAPAPAGPSPRPLFTAAGELTVLGQLHGLYILCSSPQGLVIIDQHAAHERLSYQALKEGLAQGQLPRQGLLTPAILELSPREQAWAQSQATDWTRLGLELAPFGGASWSVQAVPTFLAGRDPAPVVRDLLGHLAASGVPAQTPEFLELAMRSLACHSSVRAGQNLSRQEMQRLVEQVEKLPPPVTCPHGRPVMISLGRRDLARAFKRGGGESA